MSTTKDVPEEVSEKVVGTVEKPLLEQSVENTGETSLEQQVVNTEVNTEEGMTEKPPSEEQAVAVTGIQFMDEVKVKNLMAKIKNKPIGEGSFKKVYELNDTDTEVVSVEVNEKEDEEGKEMVSVPFKQKEKEDYETIMKTMYDLDDEHKKYLLLPTKYGYSKDEKTRVQILPYCRKKNTAYNDGCGADLHSILFDRCSYEKSIMTDCVNILKTIHELHKKNIVCMDIKLENTFVKCPDKAFLSLGDTDGFKLMRENDDNYYNCVATLGFYVKRGHFITDYYAWLQVFLLVYIFVHKGEHKARKLYNDNLQQLHGQMYMLRKKIPVKKALEQIGDSLEKMRRKWREQGLSDEKIDDHIALEKEAYSDDKAVLKYCSLKKIGPMTNLDSEVLKEIDDHIDNSKTTSVNKDYEKLIKEILGKPSACVNSILKALKACVDVETVDKYDENKFYEKYIKPITTKTMSGRVVESMRKFKFNPFAASSTGGRKSKKSSRGKNKKTRRKKKTKTRRKKKKTRRKKKKTRGKKRR